MAKKIQFKILFHKKFSSIYAPHCKKITKQVEMLKLVNRNSKIKKWPLLMLSYNIDEYPHENIAMLRILCFFKGTFDSYVRFPGSSECS